MKQIFILITILLFAAPLMGGSKKCQKNCKKKFQPESYYIHIGLGSTNITYDSDSIPAQNIDYYLSDRTSVLIDLGLYFPLSNQLLLGGSLTADIDHLELFDYDYEWEEWTTTLTSVSALYFFDRINRGLFVRGDIGFSRASYTNDQDMELETKDEQNGFGYRLGVGFSLSLSKGWSMNATLSHSVKYIDELPVETNNLSFSILF